MADVDDEQENYRSVIIRAINIFELDHAILWHGDTARRISVRSISDLLDTVYEILRWKRYAVIFRVHSGLFNAGKTQTSCLINHWENQ